HAICAEAELPAALSVNADVEGRVVERDWDLDVPQLRQLLKAGLDSLRDPPHVRETLSGNGDVDGGARAEVQHLGNDVTGLEREHDVGEAHPAPAAQAIR